MEAEALLKKPGLQGLQLVLALPEAKLPGAHAVHEEEPLPEYLPALHAVQDVLPLLEK